MLPLLPIPTKTITINSASSGINLYTQANSPYYAVNIICAINAPITAPNTSVAALYFGSGWKPGTFLYVTNANTINGANGANATSNGAGGAGGTGSSFYLGTNGSPGSGGGTGQSGTPGGPALKVDSLTDVQAVLDNQGTITGGTGGAGTVGGGGGGGGGG